ncbi:MAG TPA: glycosyltransferase family 9 protein [Caulobacteraceae bacterium]|nr:glycosyltransferase family 9 protein [Caulobacteraceae bacterium]
MASQRFPILFIAASRIGDAVLSSGLIRALTDEIEGARFTIAASALTAPLFAEIPGRARTLLIEKRPLGRHWLDLWSEVRRQRWGLVVDLRGSGLARFLRSRRRATHRAGGPAAHKVIEAARLLKLEDDPPAPFLYTSPETEARAAELTAGAGPILAIAPAAHWVGKTWPAERFGLVARELLGPNGPLARGRLMLLGGPDDDKTALTLRSALPKDRLIDLVGREGLLVSYAALKRARLFIGGDSGLMHMAAAAGAPTLGLFGPSDERLYAPWGPKGRTVRGARSFEEIRAQDPHLNQEICHMMELRVDAVTAAARRLIDETEPS